MAIDTTQELFLYEISIIRDIERTGMRLLDFLIARSKNSELVQLLRAQQQECEQQLANVSSCLRTLGSSPIEASSETVEGIYKRFEQFVRLQPSPDMLDQFAADTAVRFVYLGIAAQRALIDWAVHMGERECVECLHSNLVRKQESVATLERFSHEFGKQVLTSA